MCLNSSAPNNLARGLSNAHSATANGSTRTPYLSRFRFPCRRGRRDCSRAKFRAGHKSREKAEERIELLRDPGYRVIERVFAIHMEAFDWNCPQHITPRFTEDEIREVLKPMERRMQELEQENERLRKELNR